MQARLVAHEKLTNATQATLSFDPPLTKEVFNLLARGSPSESLVFRDGLLTIKYSPLRATDDWLDKLIADIQKFHQQVETEKQQEIDNHTAFVTQLGKRFRLPLDTESSPG